MTALSLRYGASAALPIEALLSMIPSLPRAALDRLTARMIDRLDEIDGDADLEDDDDDEDLARDDGCGPISLRGVIVWGYEGDIAG
jgi:hypothetical protein